MTNIVDMLRIWKGKTVEISFVFPTEGRTLYSKGELLDVTEDLIIMRVKDRDHWYQRWTEITYYLNRHACILQSFTGGYKE